MTRKRLYSVIVPVYQAQTHLHQCVDSLLAQTYPNLEIILVDDGSRDSSPEICDHYAALDPRVKVLHKKNGGVGSARKAAAQAASGDYILCVDADDWVSQDYVCALDRQICRHSPDVVCCGYVQTDGITDNAIHCLIPGGHYDRAKLEKHLYPLVIEDENGLCFSPHVWAKAIKRELYLTEQLAIDDAIKIGEDGAVIKPILVRAESICIVDECLYYYRVNPESATRNRPVFDWNGPRSIYLHLQQRLDPQAFDFEAQIHRHIARQIYTVVVSRFNRQDSYRNIIKDIRTQLRKSDYRQVLKKCQYKSLKPRLEVFLLRHGLLLPIYLLHR